MKLITRLAILLPLSLLGACATLEKAVQQPEVSVKDLRITGASLTQVETDFILAVKNPNPFGLRLKGLGYRLELDGKPFVSGRSAEGVALGANATSDLSLPFTLAYEEVLGGLSALKKRKSLPYKLSGEVDLGLFSLPFSKEGEFTLPALPQLRVESLKVERLGLDGASLRLAVGVKNGNDFALRLKGLEGALRLGDSRLMQASSSKGLNVAGGSEGMMELSLDLGYQALGGLYDALRRGGSLPLAFDGNIAIPSAAGVRTLPVRWQGDVSILR